MEKTTSIKSMKKYINDFAFFNSNLGLNSNYLSKIPIFSGGGVNRNVNSWIENNTLTIKVNNLLHTRNIVLSEEYRVVPLKPGNYEVKVSIICEEYEEKDIYIIPLIVEME